MAKVEPWMLAGVAVVIAAAAAGGGKRRRTVVRPNGDVLPNGGTTGGSQEPCPPIGQGVYELAGMKFIQDVSDGADPTTPLPMIIFLHSRGATMEGAHAMENRLKVPSRILTPQGVTAIGNGYGWYTARAKDADQETLASQMAWSGDRIAEFITEAVRCFPTVGMPIVTGSSQGAGMAYLIASIYPHLVAGAVGVSGWLPEVFWDNNMAYTIALHGTDDKTVPFAPTAAWAAAMEGAGAVEFWSYPGAGHSVTSQMARDWTDSLASFIDEEALAA